MKKIHLISVVFICICFSINAQNDSVALESMKEQISQLESSIDKISNDLSDLSSSLSYLSRQDAKLNQRIEDNQIRLDSSLSSGLEMISNEIESTRKALSGAIEENYNEAKGGISTLDEEVSMHKIIWIIGFPLLAVLILVFVLLFRGKLKSGKKSLLDQISKSQTAIQEESLKLDNKLLELLEKQLKVEQIQASGESAGELDHALAKKVADEVVRIEKNLSQMDDGTRGKKQLVRAVQSIKDNFSSNGYEIVEMLNKEYNDGMKVQANFVPDENLEKDQQIITRIIKPQVNYKGKMIQAAEIEVSQGN